MHANPLRVLAASALVAALGLLASLAAAQDSGGKKGGGSAKDPPKDGTKDAPTESQDQIDKAKALEKKLDAKNKIEASRAIEDLGSMATHTAGKVLMDFIHRTPNSEYGAAAIRALGWGGNREALDFLCGPDGAHSGRLLIAEAACKALAKVGEKSSVPTLLEVMKTGKTVVVCAAIESVVQLDPAAEGLASLLFGMTGNSDDTIRRSVATALGALSSPKAVDALITMAKDANSIVRLNACVSLGKLAPAKARKVLEQLAAKDTNIEVRQAADEALKRLPAPGPGETGAPGGGK
jgi:HEAT repeat protein